MNKVIITGLISLFILMQTLYAKEENNYVNSQSFINTDISTSGDDTSEIDRDSEEYEWIIPLYRKGWGFTNQNYICRIVDQEKKNCIYYEDKRG